MLKGLLIGGGIVLALILGFFPGGVSRPKPAWWRWLAIISVIVTVIAALGIPTGGSFSSFTTVTMSRNDEAPLPLLGKVAEKFEGGTIRLEHGKEQEIIDVSALPADEIRVGDEVILSTSFIRSERKYVARRIVAVNPPLTLPLIPGLEERARNLYFHVPSAWLSQLAWFVALVFAIAYLRKRRPEDDVRAVAASALGAIFCILATVTGAVWAKFNWGVFWNWDPRQISIFIVLVIYGAYFSLRSSLSNEDQRARVSSIYLILLALPVVFFIFVLPRMVDGLHPGSADSGSIGPVISPEEDSLNPVKQILFALSMFSFTMLFFWMLNVRVRVGLLELGRRRREAERVENGAVPRSTVTAMDPDMVRLP